LLRVDREGRTPVSGTVTRRLRERVVERLGQCDALLIADHDKGACPPALLGDVLGAAQEMGVPALVDPASRVGLERYRGAEALLPNRAEAAALLGWAPATGEDAARAAEELAARSGAVVLLKLDRDGLALAERGQPARMYPALARRVCDVTGAGDMVLAAAGLCRAARLDWEDAARLAGLAAARKVERSALAVLSCEELTAGKVVSLGEMEALAAGYRRAGRSVVLTNGCFDLLHAGHAAYLEEAARLGDVLVVALNADRGVRRLKGLNRPLVPQQQRAALVAALACVDHVLIFEGDTPHEILRRLRPEVLVKGGDYGVEEAVGREVVQGYGGRVCVTGRQPGLSTSRLIETVLRSRVGAED